MPDGQVKVTFQPNGHSVFVLPKTTILEAAARAGMTIDTPCGGAGTCGKCRVQMMSGACAPGSRDTDAFSREELEQGWRLACQTCVCGPCVVRVPEQSLFAGQYRIQETAATDTKQDLAPSVRKRYLSLPGPSLMDSTPDLLRLEQELGPFRTDLTLLRELPQRLRQENYQGTAVLADGRLIDFEQGDTSKHCCGIAFDIGTTTMVGVLQDLVEGRELALVSRMNPQVSFGDDVLARIQHSGESATGLEDLHSVIIREISRMIRELCTKADVTSDHVYEVIFAENTTMQHLLCGIDPTQLGKIPFVSAYGRGLDLPAHDLGLPINSRGRAYVFPVIGGFVGGDTVAGMLATRFDTQEGGPVLMVDIGTNGEIVLVHNGEIRAASTAAGPAFEGARISCGMRATRGAIEKVVITQDLLYSVIGNIDPIGICGSGLIDLVSELRRCGIITQAGRLLPPDKLPDSLPDALRKRVCLDQQHPVFVLAERRPGRLDAPVILTQRDIRELQLAAGAIRAGIEILTRQAGFSPADLSSVLIAGGFGSFIRRKHAQRLGLLPAAVNHRRIHYVGNVSLSGARWALLSAQARQHAETIARTARHVELSTDPAFQDAFADAMFFPE